MAPLTARTSPRPAYPVDGAHHDGSPLYVSNPYPTVGEPVTLRVRVGPGLAATGVAVRSTPDGDQHFTACDGPVGDWWSVTVPMTNSRLRYRFLIDTPAGALTLNGTGLHAYEVTDVHDFMLTTDPPPPAWARWAVFYEIFLDRFARSADASPQHADSLPAWAIPTPWGAPVAHGTADGVRQLYGGDLSGVEEHLGYLRDLGVTGLYLTPFFPAGSNHRYDASSFDVVDPLLGGDDALRSLVAAAHVHGMAVIGDLTLNHSGDTHAWFRAAQADPRSSEAGFYLFTEHPDSYESFGGVRSLPKLDHRSPELRRRLFDGAGSTVHRFIGDVGLDGWRIDVAQSAGHSGASNRTLTTAAEVMATARSADPDAYVVAEHQFDASEALTGNAWHGAMTYAAFTRPVWSWLAEDDIDRHWGVPSGHPPYTGSVMAQVMDGFHGLIPWRSRVHSLTLLDSHDTPRLLSIVGRDRYLVALGLLMTMPGIPMIFAGDEIGTTGVDLEHGRQPFRWDRATWDLDLRERHRQLVSLRTTHPALSDGGFRWIHTSDDVVIFERATEQETMVVQAARRAHDPVPCPVGLTGLLGTPDVVAGDGFPADGPAVGIWTTTHAYRKKG